MSRLQDGWVKAKPTAWGLSGDDPNKDPQFAVAFQIVDGPDAGKGITWYTSPASSDAAFEYTVKGLRRLGWTGTDLSSVELCEDAVSILIETDMYKEKERQQVKAIGIVGGGGGFKALDAGRTKAFAAKMTDRIKAFDAKNGGPPKPAANGTRASAAPQNGDDDIPF